MGNTLIKVSARLSELRGHLTKHRRWATQVTASHEIREAHIRVAAALAALIVELEHEQAARRSQPRNAS